jgi:hypothetical protein
MISSSVRVSLGGEGVGWTTVDAAADVLDELDENLAFWEAADLHVTQRHFQNFGHAALKFRVCLPGQ